MPPRLSVRRLFIGVLFWGGLLLFFTFCFGRVMWSAQQSSNNDNNNNNNNNNAPFTESLPSPSLQNNKDAHQQTTSNTKGTQQQLHQQQQLSYRKVSSHTPQKLLKEPSFPTENDENNIIPERKLWFFKNGNVYPRKSVGLATLFPNENYGDRIVDQLMYIPDDYEGINTPEKVILAYNGVRSWNKDPGPRTFEECPVNRCSLIDDQSKAKDVDAVLYKDHYSATWAEKPAHQVSILYYLECPYHTQYVKVKDAINWTATYRRDSDIVAPYERWTYYDPDVRQMPQTIDYAANKTKKVAWFVSNCGARNGRLEYARELSKYIPVDIYGGCGPLKCPRSDKKCFELLDKEYKFYLAFENSNCRDYITEKFYINGLSRNILPIVMGAKPEDYERSAPQGSYIHVDEFDNPKELAAYLHRLDKDDELYNSYFQWKGTGEFINTYFWCRLCAMLHAPHTSKRVYEDVDDWWRGPGVCTTKSWRNQP